MHIDPERAELSAQTFGAIARMAHEVTQRSAALLQPHGLTPGQFQVLMVLARHPDASQSAVGTSLGVTRANVSMLLAKLESAGLVDRQASGAANRLRLTDEGRTLVDRTLPDQLTLLAETFAPLPAEQLADLHAMMMGLGHEYSLDRVPPEN
jgi:DNA-binding MarR family transcriptional regulator